MPVTSAGYVAYRSDDLLPMLRQKFVDLLAAEGLPSDVDWEHDTFPGMFSAAMSLIVGELSEASQALYDAFDENNATGAQLDLLYGLLGFERIQATPSTALLTLTGIGAGDEVIPAGTVIRDENRVAWTLDVDVTLDDSVDNVEVTAAVTGPITALSNTINNPINPPYGLVGATNPTAASPGRARETDAEFVARKRASFAAGGGRSVGSIRADLLALDAVQSVTLLENPLPTTVITDGITLPPHSVLAIIYPGGLDADAEQAIAAVLDDPRTGVSQGVYIAGTDVVFTRTDDGGGTRRIAWDYATAVPIDVEIHIEEMARKPGGGFYAFGDVEDALTADIEAYFASLAAATTVSDAAVRILRLAGLVAAYPQIVTATVQIDSGSGFYAADFLPTAAQRATLGTLEFT